LPAIPVYDLVELGLWRMSAVDGEVCAICATKIVKELDKAAAEHDALIREVDIEAHHEGAHPSTASVN
jgi:hypothetical protein